MKELADRLKSVEISKAKNLVLLDTCFLIASMEHDAKLKMLYSISNIAMTSFNIEELMNLERGLPHETRKRLRDFLKKKKLIVLNIDVHPGCWQAERDFVSATDEDLLRCIRDPSDAVLLAAAIRTRSTVLTKDKHHLFTVGLENFLNHYHLKVFKEIHDFLEGN